MKARLVLPALALATALGVAGCGGGGGATPDPASLAPPRTSLYIEAEMQPQGAQKSNVESLFERISGIDTSLGSFIVSELESSAASSGEKLDFDKEVKPWLGERGGLFFDEYDGDDFHGYGVAVQTTDAAAARAFVDKRGESDDGTIAGVVGDFLVVAEDKATFKAIVDASEGESLADEESFASAFDAASSGSFADVFVDIGRLIQQSGDTIDSETRQFLDTAGIDPDEATAVASLVPGSDQLEIDLSTDAGGERPPSGDASKLLGSLPADSALALSSADFGARIGEAIDRIDADGIPGEVPPHKFKSTLREAGIDVEKISSSIGDLGVFAEGSGKSDLAGAVVLATSGSREATNTVSNIGLLLRASGTPGVTAISGKPSGFSIRSDELGPKPIVAAAEGKRIAIAYGLPAAVRALTTQPDESLAARPLYKEAVAALGGAPISGFADGPEALKLASGLIPADDENFRQAKPYLKGIEYLALGTSPAGDLTTAKLIAGLGE